mgnify:CR=1 FL=1
MSDGQGGGLTTLGKAFVGLFAVALVGTGLFLARDVLFPAAADDAGMVDLDAARDVMGQTPEAPDLTGITTVQEYDFVAGCVQTTADYAAPLGAAAVRMIAAVMAS